MNPIKFYGGIILAALIVLAVLFFGHRYREGQKAIVVSENRGAVLTNTSAGVEDGAEIDQEQADRDTGLAVGRDNFRRAKQEAIDNEPETADRADRRVPDSVRAAFRERRLARERLGCAGGECPQDDATNAASER